jgi:hypothetical protein
MTNGPVTATCMVRAVGIATVYELGDRGVEVRVPVGVKSFHFSISSRPTLGYTQLPILWLQELFPRDKAAGA